jgi:hypothetical protein
MKWAWAVQIRVLPLVLAFLSSAALAQDGDELAPPLGAPSSDAPVAGIAPTEGGSNPAALAVDAPPEAIPVGDVGDLLPEQCEGTNRSLYTTAGVVVVVSFIFFLLAFAVANRRDWIKPGGAARYFLTLLPFLAIPAVSLFYLRPNVELVALCVARPDFRHLIFLVDQPTWVQCAALGTAPVLVLALLLPFVSAPFRRRK